jgi:hypothetical protein
LVVEELNLTNQEYLEHLATDSQAAAAVDLIDKVTIVTPVVVVVVQVAKDILLQTIDTNTLHQTAVLEWPLIF